MSDEPLKEGELQAEIAKAEAELDPEEKTLFRRIKGIFGNLKGGSRSSLSAVQAVKALTKAVSFSQQAKKLCIGIDTKNKKPDDFKAAIETVDKAVKMITDVMGDFPTTAASLQSLLNKLIEQRAQIIQIAKDEYDLVLT
jgi:hypothetical protein